MSRPDALTATEPVTEPSGDDLTQRLRKILDGERGAYAEHGATLRAALKAGARIVKPGDLLAPKDVAQLLHVDRTTASRWGSEGYLPKEFQSVGGVPLRLLSDLEAFAVKHRETADAAGRRPPGTAR